MIIDFSILLLFAKVKVPGYIIAFAYLIKQKRYINVSKNTFLLSLTTLYAMTYSLTDLLTDLPKLQRHVIGIL